MGETIKTPSIFRQALIVNKKPFPWLKAFLAGIAAGLPIAICLFFGSFEYGLIAGLGGFTFLYVFPIPYAQLAKKLFWVVLSITACVFFGTLLAPYPILVAIMMGIIGATAVLIFGAFHLIGPSAIFFILVFAMTTGMPIAPEDAFLRAGLALFGGSISFVIAMTGWFFNPHGPEKRIVKRTYSELANYFESIGTNIENDAKHRVISTLKEAEQTLTSGYISWRTTDLYNHLYVLNNYANKIFLFAVENFSEEGKPIPSELAESLKVISQLIDSNNLNDEAINDLPHPQEMDEDSAMLFMELTEAKNSLLKTSSQLQDQIQISNPSAKMVILGALNKNSIVFINALRFGAFTILASIIAYELELNRSFWVPLSAVAVMSGATAVATFHRAIQRSFGTMIGILIASVILSLHPTGYIVSFFVFLLTFITELFIVKNYGLAALFFTPNALIMAESGSQGHFAFSFFATARLIDVAIGIVIGLIGVWFVGRKSASSRISHMIAKTIRSQAQVFYVLFSNQEIFHSHGKNIVFNKMQTNLNNLSILYDTASGEIPRDKKVLEYYWPIVYSLQQLGFLLDKVSRLKERPIYTDETLAQILYVFETMAHAADRKIGTPLKKIPKLEEFQSLQDTIEKLQKNLQKSK